jgi:hypothetical protein
MLLHRADGIHLARGLHPVILELFNESVEVKFRTLKDSSGILCLLR